jgi:hypothetical protein
VFVSVVGWQEVRSSYRRIAIILERRGGQSRVEMTQLPRWPPKGLVSPWMLLEIPEIPGYLEDLTALNEQLKEAASWINPPSMWPDTFEAVLVERVREVSKVNAGVGPDLMSIVIPFPKIGCARVKFLPEHECSVVVSEQTTAEVLTASYTPWLIGPSILCPPTLTVGGFHVGLDGVKVDIIGSTQKGPVIFASSSYKRPGPPK